MPACRPAHSGRRGRHDARPAWWRAGGLTATLTVAVSTVVLLAGQPSNHASAVVGGGDGTPDAAGIVDVTLTTPTRVAADAAVPVQVALAADTPLPESIVALRVDGERVSSADVTAGDLTADLNLTIPPLAGGDHDVRAVLRADGARLGQSAPVTITATGDAPPPPPGAGDCAQQPSACGFPDATNTGVPAGTDLTTYDHDVEITQNGTVFQNAVVNGSIDIAADNVTVRNVRITATGENWGIGLEHTHHTTISDCEVAPAGARLLVGVKDVYGDATDTTVEGCDIARTTTGVQTHEGLIADNYIHDMAFSSGDHLNGTTSNGSTEPLTIRHNTILNQYDQADAVSLFQDFGLEANRTITDNLLAGGSYTIYGGSGRYGRTHDIVITGNRISRIFFPQGGTFGPLADFEIDAPGNVWSGNVWDDTGAPISGDV